MDYRCGLTGCKRIPVCSNHRGVLTLAFCRTLPLVAMMEAGLLFSVEAELTGEEESPTLLLVGWGDEMWGAARVAALVCGRDGREAAL